MVTKLWEELGLAWFLVYPLEMQTIPQMAYY